MQVIRLEITEDRLHLVVEALREKAKGDTSHDLYQLANDIEGGTHTILYE